MCFAIPGKVVKVEKDKATVDYFGEERIADVSIINCKPGDYVIVSGGFVVEQVPKQEAEAMLNSLKNG